MTTTEQLLFMLRHPGFWALLAIIIGVVCLRAYKKKKYEQTSYYQVTHREFGTNKLSKGTKGEFSLYEVLSQYEPLGARLLFNLYLPRENGTTTEIDTLMISGAGIYVLENKHYAGWIFGNENQEKWYQTLPSARGVRKSSFYNPIKQNATHIRYLKKQIGNVPIWSVIVFSGECTLKSIEKSSKDVFVVKKEHLPYIINELKGRTGSNALTKEQIDSIYETLYSFTQTTREDRARHIDNIRANINRNGSKK